MPLSKRVQPKKSPRRNGNNRRAKNKLEARPLVVSVGYERRTIDDLVEILFQERVGKLLDVREAPMSRKRDFNKKALQATLEEAGIEYRHLQPAGNPHRKEKQDLQRCLKLYQSYLSRHPEVIDMVAAELRDGPVAFLCYERLHDSCHRSVLLKNLSAHGHHFQIVRVE